jgi:hypothetical protein
MRRTINCRICGVEFSPIYSNTKQCSKNCALNFKRTQNNTVLFKERQTYQKKWYSLKGREYTKAWRKKNRELVNERQRMARYGRPINKQGARAEAIKLGYKSMFEVAIAEKLTALGLPVLYEAVKIPYIVPETKRTYSPDFQLSDNVYVEAKGKLDRDCRKKMLLLKEQHPDVLFCMVFQNANQRIEKRSRTTYAEWCEKNGIEWSNKEIKREWIEKANAEIQRSNAQKSSRRSYNRRRKTSDS